MKKYVWLFMIYTLPLWGKDGANILRERVYMQTDKQLYMAGELLRMKVFTVDDFRVPLSFSKIAYVELLSEQISHVQAKIELTNGIGDGWMELSSNIPTGYYRLVAYTRFMRNETPEIFFEKNIAIVNLFQSPTPGNKDSVRLVPPVVGKGENRLVSDIKTDFDKIPLSTDKYTYIELIHEQDTLVQKGMTVSNKNTPPVELLRDLPTGKYKLTVYYAVENQEPEKVFEKHIDIVDFLSKEKVPVSPQVSSIASDNRTDKPSVSTEKNGYGTRDLGYLTIDRLPENIHTLSVSIAGTSSTPAIAADNIREWGQKTLKTSDNKFSGSFIPEYEGHIITGKVVDLQDETVIPTEPITPLLSFFGEKIRLFTGQTNTNAEVSFFTAYTSGVNEIVTTAHGPSEKKYRIDIQSPFIKQHVQKKLPDLLLDRSDAERLLKRNVALQVLYSYSGDSIKIDDTVDLYMVAGNHKKYVLGNYIRFVNMSEVFTEIVLEARFRKRNNRRQLELMMKKGEYAEYLSPLVLLDGIPVFDHELIYRYNPRLVRQINLYYGRRVFGGYISDGIIELLTYRKDAPELALDQSTQVIDYEGTKPPRQFYVPDYFDEKKRQSRIPDYRHTLLWLPEVPTTGKSSVKIPFRTSDYTGEFQVTIEGLTKTGEIIFATCSFHVE